MSVDPYLDFEHGVLRNRLGITDRVQLAEAADVSPSRPRTGCGAVAAARACATAHQSLRRRGYPACGVAHLGHRIDLDELVE